MKIFGGDEVRVVICHTIYEFILCTQISISNCKISKIIEFDFNKIEKFYDIGLIVSFNIDKDLSAIYLNVN